MDTPKGSPRRSGAGLAGIEYHGPAKESRTKSKNLGFSELRALAKSRPRRTGQQQRKHRSPARLPEHWCGSTQGRRPRAPVSPQRGRQGGGEAGENPTTTTAARQRRTGSIGAGGTDGRGSSAARQAAARGRAKPPALIGAPSGAAGPPMTAPRAGGVKGSPKPLAARADGAPLHAGAEGRQTDRPAPAAASARAAPTGRAQKGRPHRGRPGRDTVQSAGRPEEPCASRSGFARYAADGASGAASGQRGPDGGTGFAPLVASLIGSH